MNEEDVACYDLLTQPATFDFVTWLAVAKTCGAKHIRFATGGWKKKNYSIEEAEERFESILKPAVALYGLEYSTGEEYGFRVSHYINAALKVYEKAGRIEKIDFPPTPKDFMTITLRKSRNPGRDSNEKEWRKFSDRMTKAGHKMLILRDYSEVPLEMMDRIKLYARAKMNFFVNNGPAILCILSELPYLIMREIGGPADKAASPHMMQKLGIEPGFQFPWANAHQRLSYLDDTADNIEKEYAAMPKLDWRIAA